LPSNTLLRGGRTKVLQPAHFECLVGTNFMQEPHTLVKTVLVVEDYDDSRFMLARLLEMSGYWVLEAADGREAVRIAEKECPDVVLMDLQMPVLDGFTATSLIRRIESICRVPVIAVSAQSTEDFISAAKRVGCDRFVPKPVDFDVLLELIRECTEASDARTFDAPPESVTIRQPCV
jgi:two-component system cell cycle response regulator DivK